MTPDSEYVLARRVLLDALEALEPHLNALILVGAQAVYLHTGDSDLAVAPTTTDADIALNADRLRDEPLLEEALRAAGFTPSANPGTWRGTSNVALDLMVPEALLKGTGGRRGARLPVHGRRVARRTEGLEPALIDNSPFRLRSFERSDRREFIIKAAGPSALMVAKLIKVSERLDQPDRLQSKDGLDVLRILQATATDELASTLSILEADPIAGDVTRAALKFLRAEGTDPAGALATLAVRAVGVLEDPDATAGAMSALVEDLLHAYGNQN